MLVSGSIQIADGSTLRRDWDVICVGAGISTLALGAQLAKLAPHMRVLVIDKHYVPGGYASVFYRRKKRFDCSLHKLSGMGEGGNLRAIMASLNLGDDVQAVPTSEYFHIAAPGIKAELPGEGPGTQTTLKALFPHESAAIDAFFAEVNSHGRNGYYQLQMLDGSFEPNLQELRFAHRHLKTITVAEALAARFSSPLLREILAAPGVYVGGFPEDLSYLYYLHVIYATLVCGSAYIKGSSQHLSNTLAKRIEAAGGQMLLKTNVDEVLTASDGRVIGVKTSAGVFTANDVIINSSPHYAVEHLFSPQLNLDEVKQKLRNLKPSRSTTTLYAVADAPPESLGLVGGESMVFSPDYAASVSLRKEVSLQPDNEVLAERAYWQASTMEVTNYHHLDADGGYVICLNVLDAMTHWPKRDDPAYRSKKTRAAAILLDRLFRAYPGLKGHIRFSELSSPRTYERYTNNTSGAGYGAMVGVDLTGHLFHQKFPLKGVHFLSAWVAGPSYEAAFGYATVKAKSLAASWMRSRLSVKGHTYQESIQEGCA